ncbi:MAG: thioredoxin domain-containing protein [Roseivirga sp.]
MHTNRLAQTSSPYLLQHAHNPVDWYPWDDEALNKAKEENKPILVSIGYSACHWCHVMERESFENEAIAQIMNEHFVCIKVDREERPDVDQVYMEAVHAMGLQGGWPLNVFLLPDQRPFYGGTYFPAPGWTNLLKQIAKVFGDRYDDLAKSADGFMQSLGASEVKRFGLSPAGTEHTKAELHAAFVRMSEDFDHEKGGMDRAPKFPMPIVYSLLFKEYATNGTQAALKHATLTLDQMALGGIYDQVGGGFTRYSTDSDWFVPHFEKMLYDNGQLLSLYAEGYQVTKKPLYKQTVYQTVAWLEREMCNPQGGFYSALDADSEGEEGKFYLWRPEEVRAVLGPDAALIIDYYHLTEQGNWEPGKNIPFRDESDAAFAQRHGLALDEWEDQVLAANMQLLQARENRVRPGLDDKILAGWNGLMCTGLANAYAAFGEARFLKMAVRNMEFILAEMSSGARLYRNFKDGKASIDAYLEDYAAVTQALTTLYQVTFDESWLKHAQQFTDYAIDNFFDTDEDFFFFTDVNSEKLIARKKEIFDNVIPSSNSLMAENLYTLGILLDKPDYTEKALSMISRIKKVIPNAPKDLANWASLFSKLTNPTAEIAIVGEDLPEAMLALNRHYLPNKVLVGKKPGTTSDLALLQSREMLNEKTTFYVCYNKACQLPVNSVKEVLEQLAN